MKCFLLISNLFCTFCEVYRVMRLCFTVGILFRIQIINFIFWYEVLVHVIYTCLTSVSLCRLYKDQKFMTEKKVIMWMRKHNLNYKVTNFTWILFSIVLSFRYEGIVHFPSKLVPETFLGQFATSTSKVLSVNWKG